MSPETQNDGTGHGLAGETSGQDQPRSAAAPAADSQPPPHRMTWYQWVTDILFILFCLELGLFLVIYPWTEAWPVNYFAWAVPGAIHSQWLAVWNNTYVRGAVSGLGVINLWIAFAEILKMLLPPHRPDGPPTVHGSGVE